MQFWFESSAGCLVRLNYHCTSFVRTRNTAMPTSQWATWVKAGCPHSAPPPWLCIRSRKWLCAFVPPDRTLTRPTMAWYPSRAIHPHPRPNHGNMGSFGLHIATDFYLGFNLKREAAGLLPRCRCQDALSFAFGVLSYPTKSISS